MPFTSERRRLMEAGVATLRASERSRRVTTWGFRRTLSMRCTSARATSARYPARRFRA